MAKLFGERAAMNCPEAADAEIIHAKADGWVSGKGCVCYIR